MSNAEATERVHRALDEGKEPAREDLLVADTGALTRWQLVERVLDENFADVPEPIWVTASQRERVLRDVTKRMGTRKVLL